MEIKAMMVGCTQDGRPIKMRATCDTCAQSKIKCDKLRPSCMRCSSLGLRCHYSPSQRTGKQPKKKKTDGDARSKSFEQNHQSDTRSIPRNLPSSGFNSPHISSEEFSSCLYDIVPEIALPPTTTPDIYQHDKSWNSGLGAGRKHAFYHGLDDVPDIHMFSASDEDDVSGFNYPMTPGSIMQWQEGIQPLDQQQMQAYTESLCGESGSVYSNQSPLPLPLLDSQSHQRHDCTKSAFATMKNLYPLSASGGARGWGAGLPTTDQVLSTNKAALDCVQRILACPCSTDPYFMITVAVMLQKIIAWYKAVAQRSGPKSPQNANVPTTSSMEPSLHNPMLLGTYDLDHETETRVRANLILNELKKLELVIDSYAARVVQIRSPDRYLDLEVFIALEDLMRTRLEETIGCVANGSHYSRLGLVPDFVL